ncbi:hypothetical protein SAMN02746000_03096 [Paracoccus sp. J56]|nr:hypothetical protein SAMN02746000_03096 [Paracoccus sp. J56]
MAVDPAERRLQDRMQTVQRPVGGSDQAPLNSGNDLRRERLTAQQGGQAAAGQNRTRQIQHRGQRVGVRIAARPADMGHRAVECRERPGRAQMQVYRQHDNRSRPPAPAIHQHMPSAMGGIVRLAGAGLRDQPFQRQHGGGEVGGRIARPVDQAHLGAAHMGAVGQLQGRDVDVQRHIQRGGDACGQQRGAVAGAGQVADIKAADPALGQDQVMDRDKDRGVVLGPLAGGFLDQHGLGFLLSGDRSGPVARSGPGPAQAQGHRPTPRRREPDASRR